jgi:hypothetical protein
LPVAEIITPVMGSTYIAGTTIDFSGSGIDAEDGVLPPSAFSWKINFHHDTHKHDQPPITGSSGTLSIPNEGETSPNVYYRIILTVIDSDGLTGQDSIDVQPEKSTIRFTTDPPGLQITIDGQPFVAPVEVTSVEGILRSIGVITPQLINNVTHEFESWSNGGALNQTLLTPSEDVQLGATFSTIVGTEDKNGSEPEILLHPNPVREGLITITIFSKEKQDVTIRLVDVLSRDVERLDQNIQPGKHNLPFYFGKKRKGIYYLIVKLKEGTAVKKIAIIE